MFAPLTRHAAHLIDAILPQRCAACGAFGFDLCAACREHLRRMRRLPPLHRGGLNVNALGSYEGALRAAVLAIKFRQHRRAAIVLGAILAKRLALGADYLVPVPLHTTRLRERGYNQAFEIAKGIAGISGSSIADGALIRRRRTAAQSSLALHERRRNVEGAFMPGPEAHIVRGRDVTLVDDVITTAATLLACAQALRAAGAANVSVAVLTIKLGASA